MCATDANIHTVKLCSVGHLHAEGRLETHTMDCDLQLHHIQVMRSQTCTYTPQRLQVFWVKVNRLCAISTLHHCEFTSCSIHLYPMVLLSLHIALHVCLCWKYTGHPCYISKPYMMLPAA